ncbi:MAG: hypothetical protein J5552_09490 [Prevotella sp.]|nr:hypothetical protein [Prevotella sp.]
MSDKRTSWTTSIVVGTIIALIGILTGLYIADNARQQLAAATEQPEEQEMVTDKKEDPAPLPATTLDELPPLDPMEPEPEVPAVVEEEPVVPTQPETPAEEPVATPQESEQDDFEEVTPEELEEISTDDVDNTDDTEL